MGNKCWKNAFSGKAHTGTLLWHKHLGQLPVNRDHLWNLSAVDTTGLQGDDIIFAYTTYYLPANGEPNQSILYITMYQENPVAHMLYALDMQSGRILWQVDPDALNVDPNLHAVTEFTLPTSRSKASGITAGPDGNLWFTESTGNKIGRITSGK